MSNTIYLAYGSNMSIEQMASRCPDAKMLKVMQLSGFKLEFKGENNRAYATIVEDVNSEIPVMLWEITAKDEASLDQYEDYPNFYGKKYIALEGMNVMYYYMQPQYSYEIPSRSYYQIIESAYKKWGLDTSILANALAESGQYIADHT